MATTPDRLKAEAEQTREKLARDVDRLAERTSPKRKLQQGSERVRGAALAVRDKARTKPVAASLIACGAGALALTLIVKRRRSA